MQFPNRKLLDQNRLFSNLNFISDTGDKIWIMRFFLEKLEGGASPSDDIPDDNDGKDDSFDDDIPF